MCPSSQQPVAEVRPDKSGRAGNHNISIFLQQSIVAGCGELACYSQKCRYDRRLVARARPCDRTLCSIPGAILAAACGRSSIPIRGSKATADFSLAPLGPRIRQFFSEVMGQSKVIDERPASRLGPCLRILGLLRLRAGHCEPHCRRIRFAIHAARPWLRPILFRIRLGVGGAGRRFRSPACSSGAFSCVRHGWGRRRRNRA